MIKRFDIRMIELIDRCTHGDAAPRYAAAQHADHGNGMLVLVGSGPWASLGGGCRWSCLSLCSGYAKWRNAHGYWENHRKAQETQRMGLACPRPLGQPGRQSTCSWCSPHPFFWDNLRHVISGVHAGRHDVSALLPLSRAPAISPESGGVSMSGAFESTQA